MGHHFIIAAAAWCQHDYRAQSISWVLHCYCCSASKKVIKYTRRRRWKRRSLAQTLLLLRLFIRAIERRRPRRLPPPSTVHFRWMEKGTVVVIDSLLSSSTSTTTSFLYGSPEGLYHPRPPASPSQWNLQSHLKLYTAVLSGRMASLPVSIIMWTTHTQTDRGNCIDDSHCKYTENGN